MKKCLWNTRVYISVTPTATCIPTHVKVRAENYIKIKLPKNTRRSNGCKLLVTSFQTFYRIKSIDIDVNRCFIPHAIDLSMLFSIIKENTMNILKKKMTLQITNDT